MKKFAILLIILFTVLLNINAATYTIKNDGGIRNPNGRIQRQTNVNPTNRYPAAQYSTNKNTVNNNSVDSDDIIYTKAQDAENEQTVTNQTEMTQNEVVTQNTASPNVEREKIQNEKYLLMSVPEIDIESIVKNHYKDYDAAINKQAALNNELTAKGCRITIFSGIPIYSVSRCTNDENHGYFYASFDNPVLIGINNVVDINSNIYIMYKYGKSKYGNNWNIVDTTISYNYPGEALKQFMYKNNNGKYVLKGYYVGDNHYSPDGKYQHTRASWWTEK